MPLYRQCLGRLSRILLVGCGVERDYTWTQPEDGLLMKAPIIHKLHVRVDVDRQRVAIVDDLTDANGRSDRQFSDYGTSEYTPCRIVDAANWSCQALGFGDGKVLISLDMKGGHLTRNYWGIQEDFQTHYAVLGARF